MVLIDCPPNFNIVTKNAIVASQYVLVPAKPDNLSTLGIIYLQRNLNELISNFNEYATMEGGAVVAPINPQILGVLFTMVQFRKKMPINAHREYMRRIRDLPGVPVFDKYIRENKTLFGDTASKLLPVVLTHRTGATYTNIVDELERITEKFETRLSNSKQEGSLFD